MTNIPNINFKKVTDKNNTLFDQTQFYEDNFEKINTLIVPKVNELDGAIGEAEERLEFAEADLDNHEGRIDTVELNKVDKVTGKGLSTNDFTNTLKAKLETEIPAQLAEKANKIQEGWISLTLFNGWTGSILLFKDNFGIVHVKVDIKGGNDLTMICNLPSGYRPSATNYATITGRLGDLIGGNYNIVKQLWVQGAPNNRIFIPSVISWTNPNSALWGSFTYRAEA